MTKKQKMSIALMCVIAAILAALMLWWKPSSPGAQGSEEHASHLDSHGHDDRHAEENEGQAKAAEDGMIAMTDAQIKTNGIALDAAKPSLIQERLHLPAQIKVNAERTVAIAAPSEGLIQLVLVSPGAAVKKGQALVTIQSPTVAQWRADLSSAQQRVNLARTTYQREKTLWEEHISARQDFDVAQAALKEAEIAAQAARQRLSALGIAGSDGVSSIVTVRAPLDGVVVEKPAVAGQAVDATKPLLTVADLSHVWIEAAVPADSLGQIGLGMPAKISVNTLPHELNGTVSFVGPVLGEATRMATARITLPNPELRLRPGMLATVDLMGPQTNVPVTVASDAIQTIHEHNVVFVRTETGFRAQNVTIGRSDGKRTEIVKGLNAGTSYAAGGSFLLKADLGKAEAEHDD
ncbi:efflux RND transporter periplasmic adaptor subunit [Massilia forsythiae]|uniref:Efflux RND transporter periplasmic adaptor subunit n=1 Tax=Massilia forsythiae TaxID=2728020 RepID=A0A7Z2VVU1_9BURK|nr:efflux RND transporter periplasmic adaptor subunit [Massilia forsythiae]QJD99841.1 efflux RND transporter periplasmic adaptor subunit [Massilia forsythiae]